MKKFSVLQIVRGLTVCTLAIIGGASSGIAQMTATCLAENGESVTVPIVIAPSAADVARATNYPRRLILVDPAFERFSLPARTLILSHECHHVTHSYVNEDQADRYAGRLMYMAGFSAEVTEDAAKEVFRLGNTNHGHSLPLVRIRSITKGYADAAREKGSVGPSDDPSNAKSVN
jgi:hypothetical protein